MNVSGLRLRVCVSVGPLIPVSRASSAIDRILLRSIAHRIALQIMIPPEDLPTIQVVRCCLTHRTLQARRFLQK